MAETHVIAGLIKKRAEIAGLHKAVPKAVDAIKDDLASIDRALRLCGYEGAYICKQSSRQIPVL